MNGSRSRATVTVGVILAVLSAGCSRSSPNHPSPTPIRFPEQARTLDAAETAADLGAPRTAELGVWSVLSHVGLGVYGAGGKALLAGSETGSGDLFLFDFQVPELAAMSGGPPMPFSEYTDYLRQIGSPMDDSQLLRLYAKAYAGHPDAFLGQLFAALGLRFSGHPTLTPFEEWLLLLDLTPPNPQPHPASPAPSSASLGLIAVIRPASFVRGMASCTISPGGGTSGWGTARDAADAASQAFLLAMSQIPLELTLITQAIRVDLTGDPGEVHEGHDGPGAVETLSARLSLDPVPDYVNCSYLFPQLEGRIPERGGPLADAAVYWDISSGALDHGSFQELQGGVALTTTDRNGETSVHFQTIEEPSKGKGEFHQTTAVVSVRLDLRQALSELGLGGQLLSMVPSPLAVPAAAPFAISWHSDQHTWTGTVTADLHQPVPSGTQIAKATLTATLTEDPDGNITGVLDGSQTQVLHLSTCPSTTTSPGHIHAQITGTHDGGTISLALGRVDSTPPDVTPCPGAGKPGTIGSLMDPSFTPLVTALGSITRQADGSYSAKADGTLGTDTPYPYTVSFTIQLRCTDC